MPHFSRLLFLKKNQRHMHSICVWDMIKQSKPIQTRYETTYIYDRYYIRTHVYVFLFGVKKSVWNSGGNKVSRMLVLIVCMYFCSHKVAFN